MRDDDFRVRPGRIRSRASQRARPFLAQALAATQRAGGRLHRDGKARSRRSRFGRGRAASLGANRFITSRSRGAVIKTRVVRQFRSTAPLAVHLKYLRREGVTRDGESAKMFGPDTDTASHDDFAERCKDDRHHFRMIVSPDDTTELGDLKGFARELMRDVERDLGTKLDWVGVDHWNTAHPHIHILMRGADEVGNNLVISRDYISRGMRDRASDVLTQTLGPRTDREIRLALERQVEAERWTQLDRQLKRELDRNGIIDLAPVPGRAADAFLTLKVGRLRHLESLGLATHFGQGRWTISDAAENTMQALGERTDVIKHMHKVLRERGLVRDSGSYVVSTGGEGIPIVGQLLERGLHDELSGRAYAIVDGIDGRIHHLKFRDIEATGDSGPGSIVELRHYDDRKGRRRAALAVRSDLSLSAQVNAAGATWLDRQLVGSASSNLAESGFGREVRSTLEARADHLLKNNLAKRQGPRLIPVRNLLDRLRNQELDIEARKIAGETGLVFQSTNGGENVTGVYRRRFNLASGRFAMIDGGLGFRLVPWSPQIDQKIGNHLSGSATSEGRVDWSFNRVKGISI